VTTARGEGCHAKAHPAGRAALHVSYGW